MSIPVQVHIPVDAQHGYVYTLNYEAKERSPFAELDTPTGVAIEEVTVDGVCVTDGYSLTFVGNTLADIRADSKSAVPRPEIYAILSAHGYAMPPEARLREMTRICERYRETHCQGRPLYPDEAEMARLRGVIMQSSKGLWIDPTNFSLLREARGRALVVRRGTDQHPTPVELLGREVVVKHVDWTNRLAKVWPWPNREPDTGQRDGFILLPVSTLALPLAKRAASYQRIYVDAADAKNTASVPSLIASKEVRREAFKILIGRFENLFGSDVRLSRLRRFARVVQRESAAKHLIAREQSPAALVTSPLLVPLPIERPRTYVVGR